ncbi:type VII toxin-antitoxin system MntA family adenylyltransferase antitoxin [Duganella sp. PWIR1]
MDRQELVATLRQRLPGLLAVYVFGSRAGEAARADSDLDLAVLVDGTLAPLATWDLAQSLAALTGYDVDLLDLRAASTVMQHQVITTGTRLWHKDAQAQFYECLILREKIDLDFARAGLLKDIEREGRIYGR